MTAVLELVGVAGGYSAAPVLRSIDLTVGTLEIVGLLGANGAGKSTLLRAISGTLPVSSGEVRLAGRSLSGMKPWDRVRSGLVHVPEGRHVFGAMTVRENLDVAGLVRRPSRSVDDVFDLFPRLHERERQAAGSLSGGEQQMLAIGRAMMTSPAVLVIDEMSAGLAPIFVEQLVLGLTRIRDAGTAVLLVEQSPHFVSDVIDRAYLLEGGRIVGSGTLAELGGADRLADLYLGVS